MKQAAILVRVSALHQDYERQIDDLTSLAKGMGYTVQKKNIYAEKISGLSKGDNRLELKRFIADIKAGKKVDMVFTTEISRIARVPKVQYLFIEELVELEVPIYIQNMKMASLHEDGSRNSTFFIITGVLAEFAHTEAKETKIRQKSGRLHNFKEGRNHGGFTVYGYEVAARERERAAGKLIINEDEAKVVRMVYDMYINKGAGVKVIANHLNEQKIPTRQDKGWSTGTVKAMLANDIYYGSRLYKGVLYDNLVPPIISKQTFEQVRKVATDRNNAPARNVKYLYLLQEKAKCGYCGNNYVPKFSTGAYKKVSNKLYHCSIRNRGGKCLGCGIGLDKLESLVWALVVRNEGVLRYLKNTNTTALQNGKDIKVLELQIKSLDFDLSAKHDEIHQCKRLYKLGKSSDAELMDDLQRIELSMSNIQERMTTAKKQIKVKQDWLKSFNTVNQYTDILNDIGTDRIKINEILQVVLEKVNITSVSTERLSNFYIITVNFTGGIEPVTVLFNKSPIGKPLEFRMEYHYHPDAAKIVQYENDILVTDIQTLIKALTKVGHKKLKGYDNNKEVPFNSFPMWVKLIPFNKINIHPEKDKKQKKRIKTA